MAVQTRSREFLFGFWYFAPTLEFLTQVWWARSPIAALVTCSLSCFELEPTIAHNLVCDTTFQNVKQHINATPQPQKFSASYRHFY